MANQYQRINILFKKRTTPPRILNAGQNIPECTQPDYFLIYNLETT